MEPPSLARRVLGHGVAAITGAVPAFFLVFAGVFTDPGGPGERTVSLALVAGAYALLGLGFGYALPTASWRIGLALGSPAFLFLAWYSTREPQNLGLHAAYLAASLGAAVAAAWAGAELRRRRSKTPAPAA